MSKELSGEAYELAVYIENEHKLYNQRQSIEKNLARKMKSGKYDAKLSPKLWGYWVESGQKAYRKEYPEVRFSPEVRREVAHHFAVTLDPEIKREMHNILHKKTR